MIVTDLRFFVVPLSIAFNINLDSPIAVYVQIKNLIQFGIASGELPVGTPLPSARVLSE